METGYLNLHDGEHFSTNTSPLYEDMLDDSDGSLLDMIRDEFNSYEVATSRNLQEAPDLWETEQELNGDMAVLPVAVPLGGTLAKLESHTKEDFQKMLIDWQEHLGSMQVSDSEEMDVKDIVGMDMVMPKHISEHLPEDIFEDDAVQDIKPAVSPSSFKKEVPDNKSVLGLSIKEEFGDHCLQNFMDSEDDDLALRVAEEKINSLNDKQCVPEQNASEIQPKPEADEDCVDVETVTEQMPVLEAGDLKSLLEQFEASEAFNTTSTGTSKAASVLDSHLYAMATQQLKPSTSTSSTTPTKGTSGSLSHQNIRDALPQEVIDRIKASGRKRVIPVIPAIPTKRHGRGGTRMQDAGVTLSRNKLLKIVSSGGSGESVQLDHDYCTMSSVSNGSDVPPPRSFYHSDASEYQVEKSSASSEATEKQKIKNCNKDQIYSRLPEYYMVLAPQKLNENKKGPNNATREDECWGENNSKKDSGLESGEVSDASEETPVLPADTHILHSNPLRESNNDKGLVAVTIKAPTSNICGKNIVSVNGRDYHIAPSTNKGPESILINHCGQTKPAKEMAMVSVLKKCHIGNSINAPSSSLSVPSSSSLTVPSSSSLSVPSSSSLSVPSSNVINEHALSEGVKLLNVESQQQEPKKKKLNLEQYRSRLKELDRIRGSRESSRASSPVSSVSSVSVGTSMVDGVISDVKLSVSENIPLKCELPTANAKSENSEATQQRVMCSVEVQTIPERDAEPSKEKERQAGYARDRRRRHYRSRRTSSSSSSGSSSSSRNSKRHRNSRSKRRKPSHRHNSTGHSASSLESHSQGIWSRSRSESVTSSSAKSSCSSHSARSRSRSRSTETKTSYRNPDRRWHFTHRGREIRWSSRNFSSGYHGWRRSRSPVHMNRPISGDWQLTEREKQRQVEERRVIYVGRLEEGTTKADLRRRFEVFGPIVDISVHFREHGDNYGFVTFQYKVDAYEAVEHGNDDPNLPHYDLCFGGRRAFCKTRYADLDGMANSEPLGEPHGYARQIRPQNNEDSFDLLLREAQAKLRKRKA